MYHAYRLAKCPPWTIAMALHDFEAYEGVCGLLGEDAQRPRVLCDFNAVLLHELRRLDAAPLLRPTIALPLCECAALLVRDFAGRRLP